MALIRRSDRSKYGPIPADDMHRPVDEDGSNGAEEELEAVFCEDSDSIPLLHRPPYRQQLQSKTSTGSDTGALALDTTGQERSSQAYAPSLRSSVDSTGHDPSKPTLEDWASLRRVPDSLPWTAYLVAIVELCERFTYYGLSGPFQNYMSNRAGDARAPGVLGLGQSRATALSNAFQFWCYLTPLVGAWIADEYLGKYRTIVYFAMIYLVGLVVLFVTSLPVAIQAGASFTGFIVAIVVIGVGTGGIKANVSPLIAEQLGETSARVAVTGSGESVLVDPNLTIQRVYMIFYMCINLGSLSSLATTNMELHIGFWSAYLLALCMFLLGFAVLLLGRNTYILNSPEGSIVSQAFTALWMAGRSKYGLEIAKPSVRQSMRIPGRLAWDDLFIEQLKHALVACKLFLFFPFYWLAYSQMMNNFVSQAGNMELAGIPNDIMQNINPLTVIIFIPICDKALYPALRRGGIQFKPISRIFTGFILASLAMAYSAFVQHRIYHAAAAATGNGTKIHVAVQAPAYFIMALSEIFASVTGLEYAYTQAPVQMKSLIMSIYLLTSAGGAALGIVLAPLARDPHLTWFYAGLALATALAGCTFWHLFSPYDRAGEFDQDGVEG